MSHLNILTISREIESIKRNINLQQGSINAQRESISTNQASINHSKNIQKELSGCIHDLNDIKANKIDISIALDEVKNDFKFLEHKLKMINSNVKHILSRDIDYVNKNNKELSTFLREKLTFDQKKINIILYVLDCYSIEGMLLIDDTDFYEFGFSEREVSTIKKACHDEIDKLSQEFV